MKPERVFEISLEFQPSNTIIRFLFYFSSFFPLPTLNIIFLFKKQVFKITWKLSPRQSELPIIRIRLLKRRRREVKVDPKLGGQWNVPSLVAIGMFHAWLLMECSKLGGHWKVPSLVAIGMFQAWWPLECSKLGGHWKVPSLVAIGRWRKNPFHLFHFPPTTLLTPSIFSLWPHDFTLPWS